MGVCVCACWEICFGVFSNFAACVLLYRVLLEVYLLCVSGLFAAASLLVVADMSLIVFLSGCGCLVVCLATVTIAILSFPLSVSSNFVACNPYRRGCCSIFTSLFALCSGPIVVWIELYVICVFRVVYEFI